MKIICQEERLPAIVERAVWEQITKGRAGMRWEYVVDKIWMDFGGDQEWVVLNIEKFGGYKTEANEIIEEGARQALRNRAKEEKHLEIIFFAHFYFPDSGQAVVTGDVPSPPRFLP